MYVCRGRDAVAGKGKKSEICFIIFHVLFFFLFVSFSFSFFLFFFFSFFFGGGRGYTYTRGGLLKTWVYTHGYWVQDWLL